VRLLVADDERPARFVLRSFLEELGFRDEDIDEAADGVELSSAASAKKPDCAFVDVRMPGMDGLEAIAAASPSCPGTRWVIVSSYADFEYARRAIQLGVTEYLLKPVKLEELELCLEKLGVRPDAPEDDAILGPVIDYLKRNYNADVSVADAAAIGEVSPNYLSTLFHNKMGVTIRDYLCQLRIEEAGRLISGGVSVMEAAKAVGYTDLRHFARKFRDITGSLPSSYKI
jgi:Response regulator containing CheY-like receiver domain and AraC-type DNA-binding domain